MNEVAFEVLDALYFVTPYQELLDSVDYEEGELREALIELASKGWIVVYKSIDEEIDDYDLKHHWKSYYYLASKKGLLAHNRL